MSTVRQVLQQAVADARRRAADSGKVTLPEGSLDGLVQPSIERPARPEHGDYATNAAMQLAPLARANPMQIAQTLCDQLQLPEGMGDATVAPPGFINFKLAPEWVAGQLHTIAEGGDRFGRVALDQATRINVEFVSANPTGPLTVGNARGAFAGDLLCRVLEGAGYDVTREYYFNDSGAQVRNLGLSVIAVQDGNPVPEDGYHGEYVADLANELPSDVRAKADDEDDPAWPIGRWASERIRSHIEASLARLGVSFDVWKSEGSLHDQGWVDRGVARLRDAGYLYEEGGATWFRSTAFGDDKDRVVYRSNGGPTYFAADIGYVMEKFSRGFDELIYIWGADHHGTVARNRAAADAMGFDPRAIHWLLTAWVRFVRDGVEMSMSKRAGEFVTLDELLEEIGVDAARWFFGARAVTSGIDFDIELAKKQSNENPVYYVQYAHARCSSILRNAAERAVAPSLDRAALLTHPAEQALIRRLLELPDVVTDAAARRETHELPHYIYDVASLFSQFYRDCRVLSDDPADAALSAARLALVDATRQVIANGLGLMGISAPATM
jgi:arginyl-tRNA synthetase